MPSVIQAEQINKICTGIKWSGDPKIKPGLFSLMLRLIVFHTRHFLRGGGGIAGVKKLVPRFILSLVWTNTGIYYLGQQRAKIVPKIFVIDFIYFVS